MARAPSAAESPPIALLHAVLAPVIVWPSQAESFRDKLQDARLARLIRIAGGFAEGMAPNFEVALYCSSFSLCFPPSREVSEVYMFALRHSEVGGFARVMDSEPALKGMGLSLAPSEEALYERLSKWIYTRQREDLRRRLKVSLSSRDRHDRED